MPAPVLTDAGRLRLESIGFFLACFFVLAKLFQLLWNWIRKDLPSLPELGFRRAMGMVLLWGVAFELVLTMISGARELLTPGAWEKVGLTYQIKPDVAGAAPADRSPAGRRARIERLAAALRGLPALPRSTRTSLLPGDLWLAPDGARYIYAGELADALGLIAYEPASAGSDRLVILRDFSTATLTSADIQARIGNVRQ